MYQNRKNSIHQITLDYIRKPNDGKPEWAVKLDNWMLNNGRKTVVFLLWMIVQILYFVISFLNLWQMQDYVITRSLFSFGFPFARASANLINLNTAIALLVSCRNFITILRSFSVLNNFIPFDSHVEMHMVAVTGIFFWSVMHVSAHALNYAKISVWAGISWWELLFRMPTGLTGVALGLILVTMALFSLPIVRQRYFHIFYMSHYLFVLYLLCSCFHGAFCFIKNDAEIQKYLASKNNVGIFTNFAICDKSPSFWKWIIGPFCIYVLEKVTRYVRSRRKIEIKKVVQHPSNTVEIQVSKVGNLKAGQYAFLSCPEISSREWHPFTVSSSPLDDYISFHIRAAGDWTYRFCELLGCSQDGRKTIQRNGTFALPTVKIDGFYGAPAEDVFNYNVSILVGAGIGVTPFASILQEIRNRIKNNKFKLVLPEKVYFFWIAKDTHCFEWFQSLLRSLEADLGSNMIDIHIFLTQHLELNQIRNITLNRDRERDIITGLESRTHFGRPNMDTFFTEVSKSHPGTDVGVFACGPKALSDNLEKCCVKFTHSVHNGIRFHFRKENF